MSNKKAVVNTTAAPAAPAAPVEAEPTMNPKVDIAEAMRRFAPFVFTIDTDTKETVDLKPLLASLSRDPTVAPALFTIDRTEVVPWFTGLQDPSIQQQVAEAKAQQNALASPDPTTPFDGALMAAIITHRIRSFAAKREGERIEEVEAQAAAHAELVERLMDDGLTRSEAERAAAEEEEQQRLQDEAAANAEGGDEDAAGPTRPMAFVLIKGFPLTPEHLFYLRRDPNGITVHAVVALNSRAKFGKRDEPVAVVDPKAAKGKKPDPKKDPKKAGAKGGAADAAPSTESLLLQLQREQRRVPRFTQHPYLDAYLHQYDVPTQESPSAPPDEVTGLKPHDPLESEGEVCEKLVAKIVQLELLLHRYRTFVAGRTEVPINHLNPTGVAEPTAEERRAAEEAAAAEAEAKLLALKTPAGKAAKAPAAKGGKGSAETEAPKEDFVPTAPLPPPRLPHRVADVRADSELYRRLVDEVAPGNVSLQVLAHCALEQVQDTSARHAQEEAARRSARDAKDGDDDVANKQVTPRDVKPAAGGAAAKGVSAPKAHDEQASAAGHTQQSAANAIADSIAQKNKRDVSDFCDYVLAQLDGVDELVFEQIRRRRLRAAENVGSDGSKANEGKGGNSPQGEADGLLGAKFQVDDSVPLCAEDHLKLMPAWTEPTTDRDALLLGLPLKRVESAIDRVAAERALDGCDVTVRTDAATMSTLGKVRNVASHLLRQQCALADPDVDAIVHGRTHAELLTAKQFATRLTEARLLHSTAKVVRATAADDSSVVVISQNFPTDRKRARVTWAAMHGLVSFPKFAAWSEFCHAEDLFFNPPPRDSDEDEPEEAEPPAAEEEDEEEEDADDAEEELDEDGEPIPRPAKEKKVKPPKLIEPDYIDVDAQQTEHLRRRAAFEHVKRRIDAAKAASTLPLANHPESATLCYQEESFLFPDDGSVIATATTAANTESVECTVQTAPGSAPSTSHGAGSVLFGFRVEKGSGASSGSSQQQQNDNNDHATPRSTTGGADAAAPDSDSAGPTQHADAAAVIKSNVAAIVTMGAEAVFRVECSAIADGANAAHDGAAADGESEDAATQPRPTISTSATCALRGFTITLDTTKGAVHFIHTAPRDSPITAYNPVTKQVGRVFVEEVARTILADGTIIARYGDGSRSCMFRSGATSVLHKDFWMTTTVAGKRFVKPLGAAPSHATQKGTSLVTTNTDVDTQSKVTTREDGVVTVHYEDGRVLVQHVDGTRVWQDAQRGSVEVEAEGLPVVVCATQAPDVDADVHETTSHARALATSPLVCVRFASGMYLSCRAGRRVTFGHFHTGFHAVAQLAQQRLFVHPSPASDAHYIVDYALGGLRGADASRMYNVTPFGRSRARLTSEELAPFPEDLSVKHTLEVFRREEVVCARFADALRRSKGAATVAEFALHTLEGALPELPQQFWGADVQGFAPPPRSRQLQTKERATAQELRALLPDAAPPPPHHHQPLIFAVYADGSAAELLRKEDVAAYVAGAVARADLLHSDVYRESIDVAPAGGGQPTELDAAAARRLPHHSIVSVAPPKQAVRPGIPKIITDMRSGGGGGGGGGSGPMTVANFLTELNQGPGAGAAAAAGQDDASIAVVCATRHFVVSPAVAGAPATKASDGETASSTQYDTAPDGSIVIDVAQLRSATGPAAALYQRALRHLGRSVPAVIAAQLSVQRTAQIMALKDQGNGVRYGQGSSRGSRGSRSGRRTSPLHSQTGSRRSGSPGSRASEQRNDDAGLGDDVLSGTTQRKQWPTPIADLHELINGTLHAASAPRFFQTEEGARLAKGELKQKNVPFTDAGKAAALRQQQLQAEQQQQQQQQQSKKKGSKASAAAAAAAPAPVVAKAPSPPLNDKQSGPPRGALSPEAKVAQKLQHAYDDEPPQSAVQRLDDDSGNHHRRHEGGTVSTRLSTSNVHANPMHPSLSVAHRLAQRRIVATPTDISFGVVMEGFRYATTCQLTNVSLAGARFRVSSTHPQWLTVEAPKAPLAAGISARIDVEVSGTQPVGFRDDARILVEFEGGTLEIPVSVSTRGAGERPSSHQRSAVRMIGPTRRAFVPGQTHMYYATPDEGGEDAGGDSD